MFHPYGRSMSPAGSGFTLSHNHHKVVEYLLLHHAASKTSLTFGSVGKRSNQRPAGKEVTHLHSKTTIGARPNPMQSLKLHVIHSAKLSHQQRTLPLYPLGPPRPSQEHVNSSYLAGCWAHYPLIHTQAERLSSSKRIEESGKAFTGAVQLRPE